MRKMGYWQTKHDWGSVCNIYAAIMKGLETGREDWNFDTKEYEDMLSSVTPRAGINTREDRMLWDDRIG